MNTHLRVARPTDRMDEVVRFYRDGLGFQVIDSFDDHLGFDGVMLGHAGAQYHLEFTHQRGHSVGHAPTREALLVFFLPDAQEWQAAVQRMLDNGYQPVPPYNPYWETRGRTFEDADGYGVVLASVGWENVADGT